MDQTMIKASDCEFLYQQKPWFTTSLLNIVLKQIIYTYVRTYVHNQICFN